MAVHFGTLDPNTPLMFTDGSEVYKKFSANCILHKIGYFIMAPSGSGKTYYIDRQMEKHWIDGDSLWEATNAHPSGEWWLNVDSIDEIDQRSDVITTQAKKLGFWIIGASNNWMQPDAIVIPPWEVHKKYILNREKNNYDGGATSDRLSQVQGHIKWIKQWALKGVPEFKSMEEAAFYLQNNYEKKFSK